ncbi:MAG TPA: LysR family transcriptional regulator [Polyangiaceae bacterium]|jgi:DNA-binding transcriptional LysR family regulator
MDATRLSGFDLNLLVVFDVLLAERSVTRAAKRLGVSQPAVSNALARLRAALGDALLVRTADGMVPTSRALALHREFGDALERIGGAMEDSSTFDPRSARRTFVVAATDYVQFVLLAPIIRAIRRDAPGVVVRVVAPVKAFPWTELGAGSVDLVLGGSRVRDIPKGLHRRWIFRDRVACILRQGHPLGDQPLTLERYLALDHVEALPIGAVGLADEILTTLGHERRIVLTVPNFLGAPFVIATTDCCFTLARRFAEPLADVLPLRVHPLPFEMPGITIGAFWHDRVHDDSAHRWLRKLVSETATESAGDA